MSLSLREERKRAQELWLEKLKIREAREKWEKQYPLMPEYHPRLMDPKPLWHIFPRQKQAFEFCTTYPDAAYVFAKEEPSTDEASKGLRRYFVTNYHQLWHVIRSFADLDKKYTPFTSFYEVIPEGAACKLYFDLEFSKELNPEHDGNEMVRIFTEFVCQQMEEAFQLKCTQRHVIDFDASTDSKFSRHLIFNTPKAAFKDNIHAGNFVHHICDKITNQIEASATSDGDLTPEAKKPRLEDDDHKEDKKTRQDENGADHHHGDKLSCLMVKDKNGDDGLFVDQGVYTRNRNFRLYKCCKLGKDNPLVVAQSNTYTPKLEIGSPKTEKRKEYQLFLDSIISNVRFSSDIQILTFEGEGGKRKKVSSGGSAKATTRNEESTDKSSELLEGFHHSPYPDIDQFIRTCVRQGGVQGEIRRWLYFTQGQMIIYDISKNRWCGNVGRQHKSNNIMILVDLKLGIYYQKCHDPVCKAQNYRSPEQAIPPEHLPAFFDEFDEDELLAATQQAEQMQEKETKAAAATQAEEMPAKAVMNADSGVKSGGAVGSTGVRRILGGGGDGDNDSSWQQEDEFGMTDEEILAAVSEVNDSGIEN